MTSEEKILDKLDHALLTARQSAPDSLSPMLQEIRDDMKKQKMAMDGHVRIHAINDKKWDDALKRMEPYLKRSEEDLEFRQGLEQRGKVLGIWAGRWLTFAAVIGSIYYGIKHIK